MGYKRVETLGDLIQWHGRVRFCCPQCGRVSVMEPTDLIRTLGGRSIPLARLFGRCQGCGWRKVRATVDPSILDHPPPRR